MPPTRDSRPVASLPSTSLLITPAMVSATTAPTLSLQTLERIPTFAANDEVTIGYSSEGRPITVLQVGDGERAVLLVGGMHGGYEANTIILVEQLSAYYADRPESIPNGMRLLFIPVANPDGLALEGEETARFNARGVDLNRNWGCGWSAQAVWRNQPVNPGAGAFSEPETQALAAFLRSVQPSVALFYHSAANGIFSGDCTERIRIAESVLMSAVYGEAANYPYGQPFSAYPVTGTAASWADGQGIAAADVELASRTDPEFERNQAGVDAVLAWVVGR